MNLLNSTSEGFLWHFHLRRKKSVSLDRLDMDIEGWTHQQQPLESQSCGRSGKLFMKKLPLKGARTSLEGNRSLVTVRLHRGKSLWIHHKIFQLNQRVFGWCWWLWGPEATVAWGKVQTRSHHEPFEAFHPRASWTASLPRQPSKLLMSLTYLPLPPRRLTWGSFLLWWSKQCSYTGSRVALGGCRPRVLSPRYYYWLLSITHFLIDCIC